MKFNTPAEKSERFLFNMASYLLDITLWANLAPIPCFSVIVAIIISAVSRVREGRKIIFVSVLAMSLLGIVAGQMTGMSREPAVSAVIPAVLGLFGGIAAYIFATKEERQQFLVALSIIGFSLNLLVGVFWGSKLRSDYEKFENSLPILLLQEANEQEIRLQRVINEQQIRNLKNAIENSSNK
jgi:hypothetical protein